MAYFKNVKRNEIIPFLDELCVHEILPTYGKPIKNGFTINHTHILLNSRDIHLKKKTIERRLKALVSEGRLGKWIAGGSSVKQ